MKKPTTETTSDRRWSDPASYRERCAPLASNDEANAAIDGFQADVYAAMKKHHIADAHLILVGNVRDEESETQWIVNVHFGDTSNAKMMVAWALGREQTRRQEKIRGLMSGPLFSPEQPKVR